MKIFRKLVPLIMVGGILTGCGKTNRSQSTSHSQSQQASTHRTTAVRRSTRRDLNHDQNGAKQQCFNNPQQARHSIQEHSTRPSPSASDGLPTVDLGSGIKGEEDHGAGQTYVSFKMGNWKVTVHGNDVNQKAATAEKEAKSLVAYFQNHSLPVPHNHGNLMVNTSDNSARILWQEGKTVNDLHGNVDQVLQKAVALK